MLTAFLSPHSSSSSSDRHGPTSLQPPLFALTRPSSSAGTSTKKPSYWLLFPSASSHLTIAGTSAPSDLLLWQDTSVYSLCSSQHPNSLSRSHIQFSGSWHSSSPSTDWHPRKSPHIPIFTLMRRWCTNIVSRSSPNPRYFLFDRFSLLYIAIAVPLIAYCSLGHSLIFGARYEFLPLMFISSYSAIGVVASWIGFSVVFFTS